MRHIVFFLAVWVILGISATRPLAEDQKTFLHQGIERHYLEFIPDDKDQAPKPLLIYLHGLRPSDWKNWRYPVLEEIAKRDGVIILNPQASHFRWNYAKPEGMQSEPERSDGKIVDDVDFLSQLIDDYVAKGLADSSRVYVTGDSRGGLMVYELMCKAATRIAAAGPFIASMVEGQVSDCHPERPVPVLAINGTMDDNIFYDGWIRNGKRQISVPEVMEFWRRLHGCSDQKGNPIAKKDKANNTDRTSIWLIEWLGCKQDGAVKLYRVNNGGHRVPNFEPDNAESENRFGRKNRDINSIEEFWAFAKTFKR